MRHNRGFTLLELLIVIAIIGILSATVLASMNISRAKARDASRRQILTELAKAVEVKHLATGSYPQTVGWMTNPGNRAAFEAEMVPTYIGRVQDDPLNTGAHIFMYWRKDYNLSTQAGDNCPQAVNGSRDEFGFYAKLEHPTPADLATLSSDFDLCVSQRWGMNFKRGL